MKRQAKMCINQVKGQIRKKYCLTKIQRPRKTPLVYINIRSFGTRRTLYYFSTKKRNPEEKI